MSGRINIGIMGAGNIAGVMAGTLNRMSGVRCYAIASRTKEKAEAFGAAYGIKKCYGSYEEMVQDKKVDLVYIATPHSEHYENAKLCISHGKPVLCEKAFMVNAAQAKEVLEYASEKDVLVAEAMWIRYMPMYKTIRDVIDSGVIGKVGMVSANLGFAIEGVERLSQPQLAGGALLDLGVYPLNFAAMILGTDLERISSSCDMLSTGVDRQESITLHYKNGAMAVLHCSMSVFSDRIGGIYGTKGYAIIENINNFQSMAVYDDKHERVAVYKAPKQISGYEYEVEACVEAIREGWKQCPQMPHSEIIKMMQMMDSLRGQWSMKYPFEA